MDSINTVIEYLNYLFVIDNSLICKSFIIKFIVSLTSLIYILYGVIGPRVHIYVYIRPRAQFKDIK